MLPVRHRGLDRVAQQLADLQDLLQVFPRGVARALGLGDLHGQVPVVADLVAELAHAIGEPRDPQCGRAHVDSAAAGAQVEGHADDRHRLRAFRHGHDASTLCDRFHSRVDGDAHGSR